MATQQESLIGHRLARSRTVPRTLEMTDSAASAEYVEYFRSEFPRVVRTVAVIVRDRQQAEDIAQDAFVQLLRHWPKVSRYDRPDAWVRRVAIRMATRESRRRRLWSLLAREVRIAEPHKPRDLDVLDAIEQLPRMQRASIALFYLEDRPAAEIADLLGCSEATARVHLHRGRKRLAQLLGEEHPDEP
jgi:RNA polymerase sigma-70 factor, ECF subfamily